MNEVYTIGYENRTLEEFVGRLKANGIKVLIDVREIPASRKKGFSKKTLSETVSEHGIRYVHVKELGSPKRLRDKLASDSDYSYFWDGYKEHLESNIEVLSKIYEEIIARETSCLMCMEKMFFHCHRKIVADRIKAINGNGLEIKHI